MDDLLKYENITPLRDVEDADKQKAIEEGRKAPVEGDLTDKKINDLNYLYRDLDEQTNRFRVFPVVPYEAKTIGGEFMPKTTFKAEDRSLSLLERLQGTASVITGKKETPVSVQDNPVFLQDRDGEFLNFGVVGQRDLPERRQIKGRTEEDLVGGTVRFVIPSEKTDIATGRREELDVFVDVPSMTRTQFDTFVSDYYEGVKERAGLNIPELLPTSTRNDPVPIERNGIDIVYGRTNTNRTVQYPEDVKSMFFKRGLHNTVGGIYDIIYKPIAIDALPFILEDVVPTVLSAITPNDFNQAIKKGAPALIGLVNTPAAMMMISQGKRLQDITSLGYGSKTSAELLNMSLVRPDLLELYKGVSTWNEEDIANFIEGKDEQFINKFLYDVTAGRIFTKFIREGIAPQLGGGLDNAKKFVNMINGVGPKDKVTGWKTGYDFWKESKSSDFLKSKSDAVLKSEWKKITKAKQSQYTNLAFASYMKAKFKNDGLFKFSGIRKNFLRDRLRYGTRPDQVIRDEDIAERFTSFAGVAGEHYLGQGAYLPVGLAGNIGLGSVINKNSYKKMVEQKGLGVSKIASIPVEFGKGFSSGLDYFLFRVSGKKTLSQAEFNREANNLSKLRPDLGADEIETELRYTKGIINPSSTLENRNFFITNKKGESIEVTPGDGVHKKLTQLADDIKNQDEETQDYTINQIKRFKGKLLSVLELGKSVGGDTNPALELYQSFSDVLGLFTTRVAYENLIEKADYGMFKSMKLTHVETEFQMRRKSVAALSKIVDSVVPLLNKGDVSNDTRDLVLGIKQFLDNDRQFTDQTLEYLEALPQVYNKMFMGDNLITEKKIDSNFKDITNKVFDFEIYESVKNANDLASDAVDAGKRLVTAYRSRYNIIRSVQDNYYNGSPKIHSREKSSLVNDEIIERIYREKRKYGDSLYEPVFKEAANINLEGQNVDEFFTGVVKILHDDTPYSKLDYGDQKEIIKIFAHSLSPQGTKLRTALDDSGLEIDDVDIGSMDDIELYSFYLENKENFTGKTKILFDKFYGNLELNAKSILKTSQAINNKSQNLSYKIEKAVTKDQKELNKLSELKKYDQNLDNLIMNASPEVFTKYQRAKQLYRAYVAPSLYGRFNYNFMGGKLRVDRAPDSEAGKKIYKKSRIDNLIKMGNYILNNPEDAGEDLLKTFGQPVRYQGYQKGDPVEYAITSNLDRSDLEMFTTNAINAALLANSQQKLYGGLKEIDEITLSNIKNSESEIAEMLASMKSGGKNADAITKFESKINNNKVGMQAWTGKYDENGEMVFSENTPFTINPESKEIISTLNQNVGDQRRVYSYEEANNRLYGSQLNSLIKNNKNLRKEIENYEGTITKVNAKVNANFRTLSNDKKEKRKLLVGLFQESGLLLDAPENVILSSNPSSIAEFFAAEGNANRLRQFKEFVKSKPDIMRKLSIIKTGTDQRGKGKTIKVDPNEQLDKILGNIILNKYAEDISVIIDQMRQIPDAFSAKKLFVRDKEFAQQKLVNKVIPQYQKLQQANQNYGPLIQEVLGQERFDKFNDLIEFVNFGKIGETGYVYEKMSLKKGMDNIPVPIPLTSVISRVYNVARRIIGVRFVASEAAIRNMRLTDAEDWRIILSSNVGNTGDSVLDIVHDMVINNNYTEYNAKQLMKVLPDALYQSQVDFIDFKNDRGEEVSILEGGRPTLKYEVKPRYEADTKKGFSPQIQNYENQMDLLGIPKRGRIKREQPTRR
jgi:hypothetical protein